MVNDPRVCHIYLRTPTVMQKTYVDLFVFAVYMACHITHTTHEAAWILAAGAILVLQHSNELTPAYGALMGKIISATQRTVVLPDMYVYPVDAVYVAISAYTLANTLDKRNRLFEKQLSHRKIILCFFILMSYVAHGKHSNLLRQPLLNSCARVATFLSTCRMSTSTAWDTLGKTLWILNVPMPVLLLSVAQVKIEKDHRRFEKKRQVVVTESGPMLV